jgi:hypothetical protein
MIKWTVILGLLASLATASGANFWPAIHALITAITHVGGGGGQCS